MKDKNNEAGRVETKGNQNSSMEHTSPDKCKGVSELIIQKPTPVGTRTAAGASDYGVKK